ncbi:MAG: LPS export ABC transporter ATP-binding protein [Chitinophagales bacterium]|nr:LPS export ABC transporter ATP-binding protein [Chitinophagales bacterium]
MILRAENLIKSYKKRKVVNNVSIHLNQGEIVGLLGPNGAGKTTTFYMTVGLIQPEEGRVFLGDEEITKLPMYKRAKLGIGYLPQEASIFRKMSIEDNIACVLEMTDLSKQDQKKKLESLIEEFRLGHVRKSMGDVLSGGERRRTEIARALAVDPKFILLDEPFAGIDPIAVEDIQKIVIRLKEKNIGVLITDHNVQETLSIIERAYLLFEGKILKDGTAEELAADEQVRRVYLGQNFVLSKSH